jgi:hypothetical protein
MNSDTVMPTDFASDQPIDLASNQYEPIREDFKPNTDINTVEGSLDIEFPKLRVIQFDENKVNYEISVNYEKLSEQIEIFRYNQ